ncbi:hypothetical protein BDV97DRAFT_376528 [Delphinella strobiligena]|nr:hypothetical protein BDV97DRAFT_376528 [Delphinella strobiligena]
MNKLEGLRIPSIPNNMFYVPDFITEAEEQHILDALPLNRWITLSHRRLQAHPSVLSQKNTLLDAALPKWLSEPIVSRFHALGLFDDSPHRVPNHVLINEYKQGEGIMPHEDGAAYHPIVATVSLGASIVLDIHDKRNENDGDSRPVTHPSPRWRILQEPRSLLITTGQTYKDLLHGIAEVDVDEDLTPDTVANWNLLGDAQIFVENGSRNVRTTRISLTYRDVLKVSKAGSWMLGKPKG